MKKYLIALIALISLSLNDAGAQTVSTEEEDTTQAKKTECRIFECMLESLPTYVGGPNAMIKFLKKTSYILPKPSRTSRKDVWLWVSVLRPTVR